MPSFVRVPVPLIVPPYVESSVRLNISIPLLLIAALLIDPEAPPFPMLSVPSVMVDVQL